MIWKSSRTAFYCVLTKGWNGKPTHTATPRFHCKLSIWKKSKHDGPYCRRWPFQNLSLRLLLGWTQRPGNQARITSSDMATLRLYALSFCSCLEPGRSFLSPSYQAPKVSQNFIIGIPATLALQVLHSCRTIGLIRRPVRIFIGKDRVSDIRSKSVFVKCILPYTSSDVLPSRGVALRWLSLYLP